MFDRIASAYANRRNRRFDEGRLPVVQVDVPVISVGNVSTGGTGKTPFVQMLVRFLQSMGKSPAIVLRGYRRRSSGLLVVHDGTQIRASVRQAGDEAYLHASVLNVPVVVAESKVDAAVHAAGYLPCDVVIVDDGFQHRWLHRDLDIVLLDDASVADPRMLPFGRLREPLASVARADILIGAPPAIPFHGVHGTVAVRYGDAHVLGDITQQVDIGRGLLPVCAIAHPERFVAAVKKIYAHTPVYVPITYADHRRYARREVRSIIATARQHGATVITTQKDAVKLVDFLPDFTAAGIAVGVLPMTMELDSNRFEIEQLIMSRIADADRHIESLG